MCICEADLKKFIGPGGSREKEWNSILASGAVTVLTLQQSRLIRLLKKERILTSRMVDRWKSTDDGIIAKSRWCAHGFKDPDLDELSRSSPTPQTESIYTVFQLLASRRWDA